MAATSLQYQNCPNCDKQLYRRGDYKNRWCKKCSYIKIRKKVFQHGSFSNPLYHTWCGMKQRCSNVNSPAYKNYGGRGIQIQWASFEEFENDMLFTYKKGLQLDRINNNGNYEKGNCRWATPQIQANNTRRNRVLTYEGMSKTVSEWARFLKIKRSTFSMRYYKYKWDLDRLIGGYLANH